MEYWTLNEDTFDDVISKLVDSGQGFTDAKMLARYFRTELEQAQYRNCELVVYNKDNQWRHIFIDRAYNVDFVMTHVEDRL